MNVKEKKQAVIDELGEKLGSAVAFYLADFSGLNVKKVTQLRARLRKAGIEYIVVKNTLAERALAELDLPDIVTHLKGPTAVVIGKADPVEAARVLSEFAKENDNKPAIKGGIVEKRAVTTKDIDRLARLPSREQLLSELAGAMQAPMAQLLFCLQAKMQETLGLLEALKEQISNRPPRP
jgi:large subunit ribosomal protein L10